MLFLIGLDHRVAFGPCERNANQVINFVNTQLINHQLQRGAILGHAAAVATKDGEGAVAIAACSGGGKSTLSLGLLARGGNFVSNDRVLLHRVGDEVQVFGVPKLPRINPGTILHNPRLGALLSAERRKELSSWSREDLWKLEEKYDVDLALCFPESRYVHGAPLRALVVLDWDRRVPGHPRLTETRFEESEAAFRGLRKGPGPFYVPAAGELPNEPLEPDPAQYGEILSGLPTIEVTGGVDFESVAEEVAARLSLDRELEP
jgi:HprK-related kinase B